MIDIFLPKDIQALLKSKSIVFMGDSNIRAAYKDFLCLMHQTEFIQQSLLKSKMENSVFGDKLVFHGNISNGRDFREEREATIESTKLAFYFLTRVYDDYVEFILNRMVSRLQPDAIVLNSCLWDITRWGSTGVEKYKENLQTLLKRLKELFPDCLVIWTTAPPISGEMKGGFLVQEMQFLKYSLRFHVLEANHFARKVVVENGFDVLDCHHHLKLQLQRRAQDGVHWLPSAVRYVTNLLLTHISLAWDVPLPRRYKSQSTDENLNSTSSVLEDPPSKESITEKKMKTEQDTSVEKLPTYATNGNLATKETKSERNIHLDPSPQNSRSQNRPHNRNSIRYNRESHHAYENRTNHAKRLERIRVWQNEPLGYSSPALVPNPAQTGAPNSMNSAQTFVPRNFRNLAQMIVANSINPPQTFVHNSMNSTQTFVPNSINPPQTFVHCSMNSEQAFVHNPYHQLLTNSHNATSLSNLGHLPNFNPSHSTASNLYRFHGPGNIQQPSPQNSSHLTQPLLDLAASVLRFQFLLSQFASQR